MWRERTEIENLLLQFAGKTVKINLCYVRGAFGLPMASPV